MHNCLSQYEIAKLLRLKAEMIELDEEDSLLAAKIDNSEDWVGQLIVLSYLLSRIFESKTIENLDSHELLKLTYELGDRMWLFVQECDFRFIDFMLSSERKYSLTLEENLIEIQNKLTEFRYGS